MKTLTLSIGVILLFTVSAFSQSDSPEILVGGVGLGDSYSKIVRKLGRPLRDYTVEADECVGGKTRYLVYKGLTIEMHPSIAGPKEFYAGRLEVASPRWSTSSGVRIGATLSSIRKKYGPSGLENADRKGEKFLSYYLNAPGNLHFFFRRGKLVRIETYYIC